MKAWIVTLYIVAIGLAAFGVYTMLAYDSDEGVGVLVGGDAYNYIIIAVRGVGFICTGIISALIATGIAVYDARNEQQTVTAEPQPSTPNVTLDSVKDFKMKSAD